MDANRHEWVWLGLVLFFILALQAEPPVVDGIYPAGGMRGKRVSVELVGKVPEVGLQFYSSDPGITFHVAEKERSLQVADTCPLGAHWLRFYNDEGVALPQLFVVGDMDERNEVEPNDTVSEAEKIGGWPSLINGRLAKSGDVDVYALSLEEGQSFRADVVAYRIDSPIDPLLRLVDGQGNVLAWNHDRYDSLDAQLQYVAISAGEHYLMVAGFVYPPAARSRFEGSSETVYRLSISDGVSVATEEASGVIAEVGEEDTMTLEAEKEVTYEIEVKAQSLNSPLDPWLEVRDSDGKVLAKNDDRVGVDAFLSWKAPETASYTLALRDLLRKGGDDYLYQLTVEEPKPSFAVAMGEHFLNVPVGESKELSLKVSRKHGHNRPITVCLLDPPPECVAQSVTVPEGEEEAAIPIEATAPFAAVIRLQASDGVSTQEVVYPVKGASTDQGALLQNELTSFLLIGSEKQ